MKSFSILVPVLLISSCAQKGLYYEPDYISARYGKYGGGAHNITQQNRDGRGDKRFKEPGYTFPELWNLEPRTIKKDAFDEANTTTDVQKMITSGKVFSGKYGDRSIASAERYGSRINMPKEPCMGKGVISDARKIMKLEEKASKDSDKSEGYKAVLKEMSDKMDIRYNTMYSLRLIYLQGVYEGVYKGLHTDVSKAPEAGIFNRSGSLSYAYMTSVFTYELQCRLKYIKSIPKVNPYIWPCYALTDGREHEPSEYKFNYLFGDPSKVEDPKIREMIFGKSEDYYIPAGKTLNKFVAKDTSRKDILGKYHIFDAESKWYMVTMGNSKIYVEIEGDKDYMRICSLINPYRGIYKIRSS